MIATLALDDDLAKMLQAEACKTGEPFEQVVNRVLHQGWDLHGAKVVVPPRNIGARALGDEGFNYDKAWEIIEEAEGTYHR
jgi:hypothetical protein